MEYEDWNNNKGNDPDAQKKRMKEIRKSFSKIGLIYIIFVAVSDLTQWLTMLLLTRTGMINNISNSLYMVISILGMYPLAVPLLALMMRWVPREGQVGAERWSAGKLGGFFVFSMGILEAGNLLGMFLMALAGMIKGEPITNEVNELILFMEPWAILISAVIVAPIIEELAFRKFLLDRIAGYGHWTAMMVSGAIFGVVHGNFYQFFYAFGLGVVFAYIYLHTGRIRYTIGFHIMINFIGSMIPLGLLKVIEVNGIIGGFMALCNLMLMFGFMICALVLILCFWKDLTFWPATDGLPSGKRRRAVWLNVGMILFFLWSARFFVLSL